MESTDFDEGDFEFSRNYFLAKESSTSVKRSTHKLSDIDIVDEQVLFQFLTISLSDSHQICVHSIDTIGFT